MDDAFDYSMQKRYRQRLSAVMEKIMQWACINDVPHGKGSAGTWTSDVG